MPFAQADLESFVKELALPADKAKLVMDAIGSDAATLEKFGGHILRQSEFSTKMGDLQKEKERLEADYQKKVDEEKNFHNSIVGWKTEKEKEADRLIAAAREEAKNQVTAIQTKIRELATRNGLPEDEIKDLVAAQTTTVTRTDDRARDTDGRFMTKESFQTEAEYFSLLPGIQMELRDEYYRLFGNDAPRISWEKVIAEAKANKRTLTQQFEASYNLSGKRTELAEKQRVAEIEKARKEGEEAARAKMLAEHPELSQRTIDRQRVGSPILDKARADAEKQRKERGGTGPQDTVSAAVAAFNSGKYRGGQAA